MLAPFQFELFVYSNFVYRTCNCDDAQNDNFGKEVDLSGNVYADMRKAWTCRHCPRKF